MFFSRFRASSTQGEKTETLTFSLSPFIHSSVSRGDLRVLLVHGSPDAGRSDVRLLRHDNRRRRQRERKRKREEQEAEEEERFSSGVAASFDGGFEEV